VYNCHNDIGAGEEVAIVLDEVLDGYEIAGPDDGWKDARGLLVCPNMRAAEIYVQDSTAGSMSALSDTLLQDPRIDQAIWRQSPDSPQFHVATRDRGRFSFRAAHRQC
jgi:hypothetical protein